MPPERTPAIKAITYEQAAIILGRESVQPVEEYIQDGTLKQVDGPDDELGACVSRHSLVALVAQHVPGWMNAHTWIDECLASSKPHLSVEDTATFLWVAPEELMQVLKRRQAHFITSDQLRVSRRWLTNQLNARFSVQQVASLYSVAVQEVWGWLSLGLLVCPLAIHEHGATSFLSEPCWGAILTANTRPQTEEAIDFFARRRFDAQGMLCDIQQVVATLGWSTETIEQMAACGSLPTLLTPAGDRRFNPKDIQCITEEDWVDESHPPSRDIAL